MRRSAWFLALAVVAAACVAASGEVTTTSRTGSISSDSVSTILGSTTSTSALATGTTVNGGEAATAPREVVPEVVPAGWRQVKPGVRSVGADVAAYSISGFTDGPNGFLGWGWQWAPTVDVYCIWGGSGSRACEGVVWTSVDGDE